MNTALSVFPAEVWLRIIRLACTDTSFTSRTLSLVSRDIYELSNPYRLQSVALVGVHRIFGFYKALTSTTFKSRSVVHLYIGCPNLRLEQEKLDNAEVLAIAQDLISSANPMTLDVITESLLGLCIQRILSLVAETLKTLHLHFVGFVSIDLLPDCLPHLKSLVLYGAFAPYQIRRKSPLLLPSLINLRIGHHNSIPSRIILKLSILFPSLIHLTLVQPMISTIHFNDSLDMIKKLDTIWPEKRSRAQEEDEGEEIIPTRKLVFEVCTVERLTGNASDWYEQLLMAAATTLRVEIIQKESGWIDLQQAETKWVMETRKYVEEEWVLESL